VLIDPEPRRGRRQFRRRQFRRRQFHRRQFRRRESSVADRGCRTAVLSVAAS